MESYLDDEDGSRREDVSLFPFPEQSVARAELVHFAREPDRVPEPDAEMLRRGGEVGLLVRRVHLLLFVPVVIRNVRRIEFVHRRSPNHGRYDWKKKKGKENRMCHFPSTFNPCTYIHTHRHSPIAAKYHQTNIGDDDAIIRPDGNGIRPLTLYVWVVSNYTYHPIFSTKC